jgi:hypothetical protein
MYNTLAQESLANNFLNNLDNLNEKETRTNKELGSPVTEHHQPEPIIPLDS